jgi:DNA-binding PadR family transcriptional regulator
LNKVDLAVLGFLSRTSMHGYEIAEFFVKRGIEFWIKIKMPSVYKALARLEEKVHITGKVEVDENNRARKVYSITETGRTYFLELLDEIFFAEKFISPFDFWNAFRFLPGNISKEYFQKMIKHRLTLMEVHHTEMMEKRKCFEDKLEKDEIPFFQKMLMERFKVMAEQEFELLGNMLTAAELPENASAFIQNS